MRSELRSVSISEGGIEPEEAEFLVNFSAQSYITYAAWVQLIEAPKQCRADTKKPHLSAKMALLRQIRVDLFSLGQSQKDARWRFIVGTDPFH